MLRCVVVVSRACVLLVELELCRLSLPKHQRKNVGVGSAPFHGMVFESSKRFDEKGRFVWKLRLIRNYDIYVIL